jgi:drug/metabolite transporter (DMT)-like permease
MRNVTYWLFMVVGIVGSLFGAYTNFTHADERFFPAGFVLVVLSLVFCSVATIIDKENHRINRVVFILISLFLVLRLTEVFVFGVQLP